jgi:hypothetical protein
MIKSEKGKLPATDNSKAGFVKKYFARWEVILFLTQLSHHRSGDEP